MAQRFCTRSRCDPREESADEHKKNGDDDQQTASAGTPTRLFDQGLCVFLFCCNGSRG